MVSKKDWALGETARVHIIASTAAGAEKEHELTQARNTANLIEDVEYRNVILAEIAAA